MKQTKTRSVLLFLTIAMLVLTLGLGLVFLPKSNTASADEAAPELVPLADAELQATAAYKAGQQGVWWDGTQMRLLFWKVSTGAPTRLSKGGSHHYTLDPNIELTIDEGIPETKTLAEWKLNETKGGVWIDNMAAHNGDTSVGEIWICSQDHDFLTKIKEVHVKTGFAERNEQGVETNVKTTKDYYLWNADTKGWQNRINSFTATYNGEVEIGAAINPAKIEITAQFKDGTSGKVDPSAVTIGEFNANEAGPKTVQLTYQDKTAELSVQVGAKKTLTSISVEGTPEAQCWTRPDYRDLVVKAHFEGDAEETIPYGDYQITEVPDLWTAENTAKGKVSYTHDSVTKDAEFTVKVTENTSNQRMRIVTADDGSDGAVNTIFEWPGDAYHFLQIVVRFDNFGGYTDAGLVNAPFIQDRNNIRLETYDNAHFAEYILIKTADGQEKTAKEWKTEGKVIEIANTNSGKLCIEMDVDFRATVTQITLKAGLEWVTSKVIAADYFYPTGPSDANSQYTTFPEAVLKQDYVLYNGGAGGWLKAVETLTAAPSVEEVVQNTTKEEMLSKLTVNAKYYGDAAETTLDPSAYALDFDASELGESVQGTVTYRGKTATFTVNVVAPAKVLERIELSGTTAFSAARFGAAPALDGLVVKAFYEGEEEGTVLQAGPGGYTVATMDMWLAEGEHDVEVSYKEAGETKTATFKLTITAPDTANGLEVVYDYDVKSPPPASWDSGFWGPTAWGNQASTNSQLVLYFRAKGDVTLPATGKLDQFGLHGGSSKGTHILNYILINGQPYDEWKDAFGYTTGWIGLHEAGPQGSADGTTPYVLWLNPGGVSDASWRNTVKTITIKAGFQWASSAGGDVAGAVVKQDITIWNAQDAGWKLHADSVEVKAVDGAKFVKGTEDIKSLLEVKAVFGTEKKAVTDYTISDYNKDTLGEQTITVTYQDRTATLKINVEEEAQPEPTTYDVTFALGDHAKAGETAPNKQTAEENGEITLPDAPKAEDGYKFDGWYDGQTKAGDAGAKYTVTKDVTLTAHWTKEATPPQPATQYTVKFAVGDHAAAGEKAPGEQKADKDAQITLPAAPKAAEGYKFDGWYDGTIKAGDAGAKYTVSKDVTLTAHWTKVDTPVEPGPGGDQPTNPDTPDTPDQPDTPDTPENPDEGTGESDSGCGSVIGGVGTVFAVMAILAGALIVLAVRRKNND